jgi:hypothetical protein
LGFLKRQFWHASSYRNSNYGLFKDKTFLAVVIFTLSVISLTPVLFFSKWVGLVNLFFIFFIPLLFTSRRLMLNDGAVGLLTKINAVILDIGYFAARSSGFLVGLLFDPYRK